MLRITADDLAEVFDPADFKSEWTPGEVERRAGAAAVEEIITGVTL